MGVSKTTIPVGLAETLSALLRKRVLLIDLGPQCHATTMLVGEKRWRELNERGHTLATLFGVAPHGGPNDSIPAPCCNAAYPMWGLPARWTCC